MSFSPAMSGREQVSCSAPRNLQQNPSLELCAAFFFFPYFKYTRDCLYIRVAVWVFGCLVLVLPSLLSAWRAVVSAVNF